MGSALTGRYEMQLSPKRSRLYVTGCTLEQLYRAGQCSESPGEYDEDDQSDADFPAEVRQRENTLRRGEIASGARAGGWAIGQVWLAEWLGDGNCRSGT